MSDYANVYVDRVYENQGLPSLIDMVMGEHVRILDIGCGNGSNLDLLSRRGHEVIGLTLSEAEARIVRERGFDCVSWNIMLEQMPFEDQTFDAILLSHVLEHLPWPAEVLNRYLGLLRPGGGVYIALPNVLNLMQRIQFLFGSFKYIETGVMDRTHLRFFDFLTAREMVESCGLKVERHLGVGQCPVGPFRELMPTFSQIIDRWMSKNWPSLFGIHIIIFARKL